MDCLFYISPVFYCKQNRLFFVHLSGSCYVCEGSFREWKFFYFFRYCGWKTNSRVTYQYKRLFWISGEEGNSREKGRGVDIGVIFIAAISFMYKTDKKLAMGDHVTGNTLDKRPCLHVEIALRESNFPIVLCGNQVPYCCSRTACQLQSQR